MLFNYRYPLVLFLSSFAGTFVSILFNIMNWPGANLIFGSMLMVQSVSIVWLIIALLKK